MPISCQDGSTPKMLMIYHDISKTAWTSMGSFRLRTTLRRRLFFLFNVEYNFFFELNAE